MEYCVKILEGGNEKYHSRASPSNEYMNIYIRTSSCCRSSGFMHSWNLMRWSAGLSSLLSLKIGRKYPHSVILGIGCGKPGIVEKSRGANLQATMAFIRSCDGILDPQQMESPMNSLESPGEEICSHYVTSLCSPSNSGYIHCRIAQGSMSSFLRPWQQRLKMLSLKDAAWLHKEHG